MLATIIFLVLAVKSYRDFPSACVGPYFYTEPSSDSYTHSVIIGLEMCESGSLIGLASKTWVLNLNEINSTSRLTFVQEPGMVVEVLKICAHVVPIFCGFN